MATKRDVRNAIAATFLTGNGLEVAQRIVDEMIGEGDSGKWDLDKVESLFAIRRDLRKIKEAEAPK